MSFPYIAALSYRAPNTEYVSTKSFRLGQLGMTEDGTFWRMSKAGAAMATAITRGKVNDNTHLDGVSGDSTESALVTAITVGDTDCTITDATNARAADYFKDGYMASPADAYDGTKHIWKSDAEVSDTYKIYVSSPFRVAQSIGNTVHCYPSPWGNIQNATSFSSQYEQFAGCANIPITSGYYFWLKVKGPHWTARTGTWPGAAVADRQVVWHSNGTVVMCDQYWSATSNQIAGYLIQSGNYGDVLIMLDMW